MTVSSADPTTVRLTNCGPVIGCRGSTNSHAWLGIPYAAPPVGELRWRSPRRVESWQDVLPAVAFGSRCLQAALGANLASGQYVGSEDCLYLNIWSPCFARDEIPTGKSRLPVMVWIHGGGNVFGGSDSYDGSKLAESQNVLIVSLNYRLGPLGWLAHAALRESAIVPEDRSGNFGLMDIIHALGWIRENIGAFGGNPERVTIFGESGGAWNVRSLLVSPAAAGLFHGAIIQSNALTMFDVSEAENFIDADDAGHPQSSGELLIELLIRDGFAVDRSSAKAKIALQSASEIVDYLRSKTIMEIDVAYAALAIKNKDQYIKLARADSMKLGALGLTFSVPKVFADDIVLSRGSYKSLFKSGSYNKVPVIMGSTRDEDKAFLSMDAEYVSRGANGVPEIKDVDRYNLVAEYLSKLWKSCGVDEPAQEMTKIQEDSVFAYRFDWDEQPLVNGVDVSVLSGAGHGIELGFVFGGCQFVLGIEGSGLRQAINQSNIEGFTYLSDAIMSYWAEFAYTGNPGKGRKGDLPEWKPWDLRQDAASKMLIFDTPSDGSIRMSANYADKNMVLTQIEKDTRLVDPDKRCKLYKDLLNYFITRLTLSEYLAIENGLCAQSLGTCQNK